MASGVSGLLGTSFIGSQYEVRFQEKKGGVVARLFHGTKKFNTLLLPTLSVKPWTFETLPILSRMKINMLLNQYEMGQADGNDSDGEIDHLLDNLLVLERKVAVSASATTIGCSDKNVKGGELIAIVHELIQTTKNNAVDYACEYERDQGEAMIFPPDVKKEILFINESREWLMSLGGWKGMMPSKEAKNYFFYQLEPDYAADRRFLGVCIFQNGLVFPIKNGRLHITPKFSINGRDVTGYSKKVNGKWESFSSGKTDLSYPQILEAINAIKTGFKLSDPEIAELQLSGIGNVLAPSSSILEKIPKKNEKEVLSFLDYLNALMFGMEASGLNAAVVTGLMTLDLIVKKDLDYETAFKANADGGVYPYACFGDNKGTYAMREKVMLGEVSMRTVREKPELSPVGIKEAMLIARWLRVNQVTEHGLSHAEQVEKIKVAIQRLIDLYYFGYEK